MCVIFFLNLIESNLSNKATINKWSWELLYYTSFICEYYSLINNNNNELNILLGIFESKVTRKKNNNYKWRRRIDFVEKIQNPYWFTINPKKNFTCGGHPHKPGGQRMGIHSPAPPGCKMGVPSAPNIRCIYTRIFFDKNKYTYIYGVYLYWKIYKYTVYMYIFS